MGAEHVYASPPHPAEWPPARGQRYPRSTRSDLGARISAFQDALPEGRQQHRDRPLDQPNAQRLGHDRARRQAVSADKNMVTVGFAGMTHLGLNSAAASA